ncbi:MAG: hypothetical protein AAF689_11265 [Pseudomonadota bacterium]
MPAHRVAVMCLRYIGYRIAQSCHHAAAGPDGTRMRDDGAQQVQAEGCALGAAKAFALIPDAAGAVAVAAHEPQAVFFTPDCLAGTSRPKAVAPGFARVPPDMACKVEKRLTIYDVRKRDAAYSARRTQRLRAGRASRQPFRPMPLPRSSPPCVIPGDWSAHSPVTTWPKDGRTAVEIEPAAGLDAQMAATELGQRETAINRGPGLVNGAAVATVNFRLERQDVLRCTP